MVFIYALIDPFTFKVRYIGKSIRPKERLMNQLNENSKTYRTHWIKYLKSRGKRPIQVILQELKDEENWQEAERKWIRIARKHGWNLVNCTDGGDGVINLSGESKERLLKTWKGRKHKPESIEKMRIRSSQQVRSESSKVKLSLKMKGRKIEWREKLKNAVRKFSDQDIIDVQSALKMGIKVIDLAKRYNVHRTTITKIKMGTYLNFKQKTVNYKKPRLYDTISSNQL